MSEAGPSGDGESERQDPQTVREAGRACVEAGAAELGLAMMAIAVRRSGATARDWATIVRALTPPEPAARVEDAEELAELCLRTARAESPGDREIEELRAQLASVQQGMAHPYRGAPAEVAEVVPLLFDALESLPSGPADAFLEVAPEVQDVVVTELADAQEPRTAALVASILRADANPALHCFLLDQVSAWATHPDIRDAAFELADSGQRSLLEPSISDALAVIERERGAGLRRRPTAGRAARQAPSAGQVKKGKRALRNKAPCSSRWSIDRGPPSG
ncbi:MAG: hypothetical protein R3F14_03655 [Polyangiaceae bacterium]